MALHLSLKQVGKKFNKEWIFRKLDLEIPYGTRLAVLGGNGSGKSTLLQVMAGFRLHNEGKIDYLKHDSIIEPDKRFRHISFCSPFLELIDDFTLFELAEHCHSMKPFMSGLQPQNFCDIIELKHAENKLIRNFSSGMKQRVKLGLAILSNTEIVFLDEPISNLDQNAIAWYKKMLDTYALDRSIVVCSNNIREEIDFCDRKISVEDFKN